MLEQFNLRRRPVTGEWQYFYRASDSTGDTVNVWFSEWQNFTAAQRFLRKAFKRHGRPGRSTSDDRQTNHEAILSCDMADRLQERRKLKPICIRQSIDLNNRVEQDYRAIKGRVSSMLGLESISSARVILSGIELVHMVCKGQAKYACRSDLSLVEQFDLIAA
ncbi:hypothetical protein MicloDRAFT_00027220 [Microvirga lotononidis]|uniref:DDE domain-containing protein n=1 Tax=Microvirga lotononidis TaxID=864069 RepID=I4YX92_9HYPH|nr:hypothetical protein MicloDRAFT_00027220 [Microvirga lotononidis]